MAGTIASITHTFASGTKAKSSEVNANFTDMVSSFNGGTINPVFNKARANEGIFAARTSTDSLTIPTGTSMFTVGFEIASGHTYVVPTSSALGVIGELTVTETLTVSGGTVWVV